MPAPTAPTPIPETLAALKVDPQSGLAASAIEALRAVHGFNEVAAVKAHPLRAFLGKFWGLSAWMLEAIAALSLGLRNYPDLAVVEALLVVNAVLATLQERRAAGVVEALRQRLRVNARVKRDGAWRELPARELVPGDILRLRAGDIVPADVQLLDGGLDVDQSSLTGESKDVSVGSGGVAPSGAVARRGEAKGVVLRTGAGTQSGRTLDLVQKARPKFHLDAVMAKVIRWLFLVVGALLALVLALALLRGTPLLGMAPLMLILLMSAIPVALPVMFTVSMAVGCKELAGRGVLVTRLSAIEDAATMDTLCVDKTGTLTLNQVAITGASGFGGATEDDVLFAGALASKRSDQDPIDLAFLDQAQARRLFEGRPPVTPLSFEPFDPAKRRTEAVAEQSGQRFRVMKGSLEAVAAACALAPATLEQLKGQAHEAALKGCRTLAVARGPEGGPPALLGLVSLVDPLRPDAAPLVSALKALGVRVRMLTGDALEVASEAGRALGLARILRLSDLPPGGGPGNAKDPLAEADGLAQVYPEDKYAVVQRLQAAGHVTGMTGDGVNDAPALRQAEVGIAVSSSTDVAKGAASVVLTEAGLVNIVALVQEGRSIYQRILTYIVNKISRTILKTAYVALAFVLTGRFALTSFTLLLLVFITDFAKVSLATDRVRPSPAPETWALRPLALLATVQGVLMVVETLAALAYGWRRFNLATDPAALNSFSFLALLYFAAFSIISARERRRFWATWPSATVIAAVIAEACLGTLAPWVGFPGLKPLPWPQVLGLFGYALAACLGLNDAVKAALGRRGSLGA